MDHIPASPALSGLSDASLIERIHTLGELDRRLTVTLLLHLCEFDSRRLFETLGYPSLFAYCVEVLRYSEDVACKRIAAARITSQYPTVVEMLSSGKLSVSGLVIIGPSLTADNHEAVLSAAAGKSKRELEVLAATLLPGRPIADRLKWINAEEVEVRFSADRKVADLLERMREISRHRFPDGRYGDLVEEAVELYLECHDWERDMLPSRRREAESNSRKIPNAIKLTVWQRDQGRCTYVSQRGKRCSSKSWLEFDHVKPWARGGRSDTEENVRLLCRNHNQLMARQEFGAKWKPKAAQDEQLPLIIRPGADTSQPEATG
jgi:5-methylcytosine-specific restriction endonuclease McrA